MRRVVSITARQKKLFRRVFWKPENGKIIWEICCSWRGGRESSGAADRPFDHPRQTAISLCLLNKGSSVRGKHPDKITHRVGI